MMKNSVSVQARGCAALGNLALVDSMSRATIAAKGGVGLILDAMRVHSDHGPVQAWGCDALANLALDVDLQEMITKEGAIEEVLEAMGRHENSADVRSVRARSARISINSLFHVSIASLKLASLTHTRKKITRKSSLECIIDDDENLTRASRSNTGTAVGM